VQKMVHVFRQKNVVKVQMNITQIVVLLVQKDAVINPKQCAAGCFSNSDYVRQNNSTNSSCIHRDACKKL
jgi:hypothetical protein